MAALNKGNLKLAIQKEGRLTEETLSFLRKSGFDFESYKTRLFSSCRNFPLEIIYVRDNDIPEFVSTGVVDLGIVGQNLLYERQAKVRKLLNLRYGFCSLVLAIPKDSKINSLNDLAEKKIATTYPVSTKSFFQKVKIQPEILKISGSLEITPALGIADAISDLTSTGSTLALNDLKIIAKIYDSEAVFITNENSLKTKRTNIEKIITRFKGVLSSQNYKYIILNAEERLVPRLKKIIPGLKSPTISSLAKEGWVSVASVVKEDIFWETIEKLKTNGATGILVLPIEKMML